MADRYEALAIVAVLLDVTANPGRSGG